MSVCDYEFAYIEIMSKVNVGGPPWNRFDPVYEKAKDGTNYSISTPS